MSKEENNEATKYRRRLDILEFHLGSDYYKTGQYHSNISKAMQEYSDQQSNEVRDKAIQQCIDSLNAKFEEMPIITHKNILEELEKLKRIKPFEKILK